MGWAPVLPQNPQSPIISKVLVEGGWTHAERGGSDKGSGQKGINTKPEKWPLVERERPTWQSPRRRWELREWGGKGVDPL